MEMDFQAEENMLNQSQPEISPVAKSNLSPGDECKQKLIRLFKGSSQRRIKEYFSSEDFAYSNPMLETVVDQDGFTLLHHAAYKKYSNDFEIILMDKIEEQCLRFSDLRTG